MHVTVATLTGVALTLGSLTPAFAAPTATASPTTQTRPATGTGTGTGTAVSAAAARTETMTHWSCDRAAKATVSVTWRSRTEARVRWRVTDMSADGRTPVLKILGLDHNGAKPSLKRRYFSDDGKIVVGKGRGASRSNGRVWAPSLRNLDEIEVWIWTSVGSRRTSCGYNIVKRLNDHRYSPKRTEPLSYSRSKKLRNRIVAEAWRQYRGVNHESGDNCSKFSRPFYEPNLCHAWCADFAWWVWSKAGVQRAKAYNSSYTDDFRDEWRVRFKPLGGPRKPTKGDVVVWSHRTDGINGHVGVVVATKGWKVKMIHGNWSDRVSFMGWIDPFTSRQDHGNKRVIGFASPA